MADETLNVEATQPTVEAVATESIESTTAPEAAPTTDATSKENAEVEGVKSEETKAEEIKPEETKAVETKNGDAEDTGMLKTKARVDYNHRKNNKFDPSTLPETDNPSEIRAQVRLQPGFECDLRNYANVHLRLSSTSPITTCPRMSSCGSSLAAPRTSQSRLPRSTTSSACAASSHTPPLSRPSATATS